MCYPCLFLIIKFKNMYILQPGEKPEIESENETDNPNLDVS